VLDIFRPKKGLHLAAKGDNVRLRLIALRQNLCQRWPLPARGDALQDNLRTGNDLQTLGGLWLDRRRHYGEDWQKHSIHQRRAGPAMRAARSPKTCRFRTNISHSCSSNRSAGRRTGNRRAYERRGSCRSAWQGATNSANIRRSKERGPLAVTQSGTPGWDRSPINPSEEAKNDIDLQLSDGASGGT
jgi:hypothetical protein